LLAAIAANPSQCIGELSLLSPAERREILQEWSQKPIDLRGRSLSDLLKGHLEGVPGPAAEGQWKFYVLDSYQHPAPIGVLGEIYIDAAVGPLPAETQERTDGVSVAQQNGEARLLRTDQRARYSPDGGIELLGETGPSIAPERDNKEEAEEARSMTPTEQVLAEIWSEVIGVKEVGLHDNFFDLGGHSVLVTQIIARIRSRFQIQLDLRTVFESPTIGLLAAAVEEALVAEIEDLPEVEAERLSGGTELATEEAR